MTKEVEVGDEFTGKVVKTTTFGAFVELAKGTDGLLHISNVSPGQRVATVEEVLNKGDEISVRVVEVDRERGRIGLRLAEDPEIAGKTKEELATVGTGGGGRNGGGDRGPRRAAAAAATAAAGRERDRGARRTVTASAAPRARSRPRPRLRRIDCPTIGSRSSTQGCGSSRRPCPPCGPRPSGFFVGTGSRGETAAEAGLSHFLEHLLFRGTTATRRRRSTSCSTRWAPSSTPAPTRRAPRSTRGCSTSTCRAAFDVMADMVWRPAFRDVDPEREVVLEEIAMYEDDPQDTVFDVLGQAVFGEHPLGRPIIGRAPGDPRHAGRGDRRLPRRAATCPARS